MPRQWNPNWAEPADEIDPAYVERVHRGMLASVDWMEAHPGCNPMWKQMNMQRLSQRFGILMESSDDVVLLASWDIAYVAQNEDCKQWFKAIVDAVSQGVEEAEPSAIMMGKAIAAGMLVCQEGWEAFNQLMLNPGQFMGERRA